MDFYVTSVDKNKASGEQKYNLNRCQKRVPFLFPLKIKLTTKIAAGRWWCCSYLNDKGVNSDEKNFLPPFDSSIFIHFQQRAIIEE